MDDALHKDDDADDLVEVDVVVERQIRRQPQRSHQCHAVSVIKVGRKLLMIMMTMVLIRALGGTQGFHKRAPPSPFPRFFSTFPTSDLVSFYHPLFSVRLSWSLRQEKFCTHTQVICSAVSLSVWSP